MATKKKKEATPLSAAKKPAAKDKKAQQFSAYLHILNLIKAARGEA